jgi:hypothetical protein
MPTLAKDLVEAQGQIEILKASLATVTQERDALATSLKVEQDAHSATKSTLDVTVKQHAESDAKLDAETKAHVVTREALADANRKLADPGYLMASVSGSKTAVPEGGTAETQAAVEGGPVTQAQALAQYRKLDGNPEEQKAFRVKYWRILGCAEEVA